VQKPALSFSWASAINGLQHLLSAKLFSSRQIAEMLTARTVALLHTAADMHCNNISELNCCAAGSWHR
jgi:hypothetical protein